MRRTPLVRRSLATAASALLAAGVVASTSSTASAADPVKYVNLGDSYSAGSGVTPYTDFYGLCMQSTQNWSHVIAASKGYALTDVSCGAAQTKDLTSSQYSGLAPQLDAVTADTDVVTLTMGGNDNNTFVSAVLACGSAGIATGGFGSPCKTLYGSTFTDEINSSTYPALVKGLNDIKAKAPGAKVAISG
ncbi:GDSL-type esterase/lipase family protein [Luteipulveratus halotolerans]|uniref:GDSL-type esterase/lipase family protein n=1 Tax=Luteipulveratus halotolerans TaxID=1631356 RepID=UPI0006836C16|nr:GDSL-type esterase/lipase family protein [Luteipulveratus halotolerans]